MSAVAVAEEGPLAAAACKGLRALPVIVGSAYAY